MYNIAITSEKLSTIIMSLELEAHRIKEYYAFMIDHNVSAMSTYDKERLASIEALTEELKKARGH